MTRPPHRDDPSDGETPGAPLREFLESVTDQLEDYARRRPVESVLVAFIAGMVLSDLFRRNR